MHAIKGSMKECVIKLIKTIRKWYIEYMTTKDLKLESVEQEAWCDSKDPE